MDQILPVGQEPNLSTSWFWLTDGDLWLQFGDQTIYEYSQSAINYWGGKSTPYNDYPLVRFIEDFTGIFDNIRETIPEEIYSLTKDLKKFQSDAKKWLDIYDTGEDGYSDFYFEEYNKLISWTYQRSFDSGHLIGGPHLYFFRCNDKMRIVWDTEFNLENGISIWIAKDGSFEMDYYDFIQKIKTFGQSFFSEMENQVELAVSKDWGSIRIDKQRLVEEHKERKDDFFANLLLLEQVPSNKTNWTEIELLYKQMTKEVK